MLKWIEVDLPELSRYKEDIPRTEVPRCALERVALDLSNVSASCASSSTSLAARRARCLILTEGILIYLSADQVVAFARDLGGPKQFPRWVIDLASPGLLRMLQRHLQPKLDQSVRR